MNLRFFFRNQRKHWEKRIKIINGWRDYWKVMSCIHWTKTEKEKEERTLNIMANKQKVVICVCWTGKELFSVEEAESHMISRRANMCKYFKLLLLLLEFCFYPCFLVQSHYSSLKFFLSAFIVRPRCESVIGLDSRIKS